MTAELEVLIKSPAIERYSRTAKLFCRACGVRTTRWTVWVAALNGGEPGVNNLAYCRGGKLPTEQRNPIQAMMSGEAEKFNPCAGVEVPHLHLTCRMCGFSYLMATATAIEKVG